MTKYEMKMFVEEKFGADLAKIKMALEGLKFRDAEAVSDDKFSLLLGIIGELIGRIVSDAFSKMVFSGADIDLFTVVFAHKLGDAFPSDFPWVYLIILNESKMTRFEWVHNSRFEAIRSTDKVGLVIDKDGQLEIHFYPEEGEYTEELKFSD